MFKVKQKITSILVACLTAVFALVLAIGGLFAMPKTTASAETTAAGNEIVATFEFGENGAATHQDGNTFSSYEETSGDYTLKLSKLSNAYKPAYDAKGNSCIKLGASSKTGGFTFTVPDNIVEVVIFVAKYKANTSKFSVNDNTKTLSKNSNDGAYDEISVETTTNKTIAVATVSGGVRAMVNTIVFAEAASGGNTDCDHNYDAGVVTPPTCTEKGFTTYTCSLCGHTYTDKVVDPQHTEQATTQDATCTEAGLKTYTCTICNNVRTEEIPALGHNYEDDTCSRCGEAKPNLIEYEENLNIYGATGTKKSDESSISWTKSMSFTFTNYKGSTPIRTTDTDHYRAYTNSKNEINLINENAFIQKIVITCAEDYAGKCQASIDDKVATVTVNGTSVTIIPNSQASSFEFTSKEQWRLTAITVSYAVEEISSTCEHSYDSVVTNPTCEEDGYTTHTCSKCNDAFIDTPVAATGHTCVDSNIIAPNCVTAGSKTVTCTNPNCNYSENVSIPATGHTYVSGICKDCGEKQKAEAKIIFDDKAKRTEYSTNKQVFVENGVTVTNTKTADSSDIVEDVKPVKFYKNSILTVEYSGIYIEKIVFQCNTNAYATALKNSIGAEATVADKVVTVLLNTPAQTYTITLSAGQVRVDSLTVYAATTPATIDSASVTIGEDLKLNYYVTLPDVFEGATMKFTVAGSTIEAVGEKVGEQYKFSLSLAPQYMAENVTAELLFNGEVIASKDRYSIKTYAQNKLNDAESSDKLKRLVSDMLYYGAAAQNYRNYKTDELVTADVENLLSASDATPNETDFTLIKNEEIDSYPAYFTGATVYFSDVNCIVVKLSTTENVTLKIGNVEVEVTGTTIYTEAIKATGFATPYTFELYHEGVLMQTLTYSINAYAYAKKKDATMGELALALYRYGLSATAYKN